MRIGKLSLDPFRLPSGTFVRFVLLVAAAFAVALGNAVSVNTAMALGVPADEVIAYQKCILDKVGAAVI